MEVAQEFALWSFNGKNTMNYDDKFVTKHNLA